MRRRSLITLTLCATFAFTVSGVACTFGTDCDFGKCDGPKVGAESPDGSSIDGGADVDASPIPPSTSEGEDSDDPDDDGDRQDGPGVRLALPPDDRRDDESANREQHGERVAEDQ